jgi:hypothetical protein
VACRAKTNTNLSFACYVDLFEIDTGTWFLPSVVVSDKFFRLFHDLPNPKRRNNIMNSTTTRTVPRTATDITSKSNYCKKKLEGIKTNEKLLKCWAEAIDLIPKYENSNNNDISKDTIQVLKDSMGAFDEIRKDNNKADDSKSSYLPMYVLFAIKIAFQNENKLDSLEEALTEPSTTSLVFTSPTTASASPSSSSPDQQRQKFLKRMQRLRLQNEESKYSKLTDNLQDHRKEDDITAKSMTYAASVGLNMIIAPLSFGCFMYFFAGGVLDFLFPAAFDGTKRNGNSTDIKRVIVGVVSGVIMMIIEMILFVIRTHEFEEHSRKKKKKKGIEPFGAYSSKKTPAVYSDNNMAPANKSESKSSNTIKTALTTKQD